MWDRQAVKALQWLANIGRTRNIFVQAGNVMKFHLPGVHNVNVDGYRGETNGAFE